MLQNKRFEIISDLIQREKIVDVKQLSELLKVTEKTIRLDLEKLETTGILKRVHGGAVLSNQQSSLFPITSQREIFSEEKAIIAHKALEMLRENDVILLDDGTTSLALAKLLGGFKLTVLTNDIFIVNELLSKPNITLYVIGGSLKREASSYVINGEDSIQFIKKYRVNKLFLGISTIDAEDGLMIYYYGDRSTKRAFIAAADQVICMATSSKFNQTAFTRVAQVSEIDIIITDSQLPEAEVRRYEKLGPTVIVAD